MHIKNFDSFNEGLLGDFSSKLKKTFSGLKPFFSGSKESSKLKKWDISSKKISDTYFQFIHNNRVIAELKLVDNVFNRPTFGLTIYFYETEIENKKNLSLSKKFEGQEEQPYAKGSKKFFSVDEAIDYLIAYWSKNTNSGKAKNPEFKIKIS
jgi:hypothetical protein